MDESRRGGRAKGKGSNQAHRRAKQAPSALWDLWPDAPSARCPSVPCRQVMVGRDLSANDHQIHRPSPLHLGPIESWCNADPPTPRWHTPLLALTLVATRPCVGRPAPPRIAELVRVRAWTRAKVSSTVRFSSLAAELPRTIRETAVCKPASSARPTVELAPWRKETCSCWQEEGSSIAAAFGPLRAKDGGISPLASKQRQTMRAAMDGREEGTDRDERGWGRRGRGSELSRSCQQERAALR